MSVRGGWGAVGQEACKNSLLFPQFYCEPKTALQNVKIILNIENMELDTFLFCFLKANRLRSGYCLF